MFGKITVKDFEVLGPVDIPIQVQPDVTSPANVCGRPFEDFVHRTTIQEVLYAQTDEDFIYQLQRNLWKITEIFVIT